MVPGRRDEAHSRPAELLLRLQSVRAVFLTKGRDGRSRALPCVLTGSGRTDSVVVCRTVAFCVKPFDRSDQECPTSANTTCRRRLQIPVKLQESSSCFSVVPGMNFAFLPGEPHLGGHHG